MTTDHLTIGNIVRCRNYPHTDRPVRIDKIRHGRPFGLDYLCSLVAEAPRHRTLAWHTADDLQPITKELS